MRDCVSTSLTGLSFNFYSTMGVRDCVSTSLNGLSFNFYSTSGAIDLSNVQKWPGIVKLRAMFFFQATAPYRDARGWCNHFV